MERAVRGATKQKNAAPKDKYLQVLLPATSSDFLLQEIFTALHYRLRENSWTVVFKSLIVLHILIRQGSGENVLRFLLREPNIEQTKNIHAYAGYIEEKISSYHDLKVDFVETYSQSAVSGRLRKLTVAKGLLREVKILQRQLGTLLKCKFFLDEVDNEVTLTAFRLLVSDLLALFKAVNEGVINVLEQYCEMSLIDAKDALEIYRTFVKQTEGVVDYLSVAKKLEAALRMPIPNLKHAPVSMTVFLEEYVNDPDFEKNRQEYKLSKTSSPPSPKSQKTLTKSKEIAKTEGSSEIGSKHKEEFALTDTTKNNVIFEASKPESKEKDFIDLFSRIEQEQTLLFGNQSLTGVYGPSTTNPFLVLQQQQQQQISQENTVQQLSQLTLQELGFQSQIQHAHDTNPFRASMLMQASSSSLTGNAILSFPQQQSSYNSFQAQQISALSPQPVASTNPFLTMNSPIDAMQFDSQSLSTGLQSTTTSLEHHFPTSDSNPFRRLTRSATFDLSTYQAVLNGDENTDWALYGYDKATNDLKVLESGGGGLEELEEEFNDGKIQYAFVRVKDPNTGLPKFILIGWCGEGVPEAKKGLFNSHFNEVANFLKGYHLQINARSEAYVEPSYIMKRINESSGSKYSIHKEAPVKAEPVLPVRSVYQPVKIPDIAAMQRSAAAEDRIKSVSSVYQRTQLPSPKPLGTRSTWTKQPDVGSPSPAEIRAQREYEETQREEEQAAKAKERIRSEEQRLSREREKERKQAEEEERQREEERLQAEERERIELESRKQREAEETKKKTQESREREEAQILELERAQEAERQREEEEIRAAEKNLAETAELAAETALLVAADAIVGNSAETLTAVVLYPYDAAEDNEMSLVEGEVVTNIIQVDEGWWQGVGEDGIKSGLFPANYVELIADPQQISKEELMPKNPHELELKSELEPEPEPDEEPEQESEPLDTNQMTVVALYEYEAAEDNEISFVEGEIITNIEYVSEDWWKGVNSEGAVGLFPANYVEQR
ncbi:hypothetical protein G9A89_011850 [Geosiphon pyriformis]|nr:hypothetical protein G9A89_011850 [Geosiphon pyriformis]